VALESTYYRISLLIGVHVLVLLLLILVSASEMTYIVSSGALNSTHSPLANCSYWSRAADYVGQLPGQLLWTNINLLSSFDLMCS